MHTLPAEQQGQRARSSAAKATESITSWSLLAFWGGKRRKNTSAALYITKPGTECQACISRTNKNLLLSLETFVICKKCSFRELCSNLLPLHNKFV